MKEGTVFCFEEYIAGKLLRKSVVYTRVSPNEHIEFAPTSVLLKLFLPRMIFRLEPESDGCRFTAEIHLRIGPLGRRANRKELDAVRHHMRAEGVNIKRILEERGTA
ncbi:MAG: hypothetical protein EA384_16825 [Spirochaetaceae bacterium]|nr:MAG: hypothetical protein EA384_16825 [Spirochaetaceae bacterium]